MMSRIFFCNFKRFDCFPSSGTQGLPPPVRAFLVAGLDLSTRAWRDARSPSCRPCGRPLTLTHTRTRTGTALGGALGLPLTWRERVTTHEPLSIHPSPVLFSHPQLSIDPARETTLCSERWASGVKKSTSAPAFYSAAVAVRWVFYACRWDEALWIAGSVEVVLEPGECV